MKKLCCGFLCLLLLIGALPLAASPAHAARKGDWEYSVVAGETTVTAYKGTEAIVEIPAALGGATVTRIGNCAFSGNVKLKAVTIPDSVTSIETGAFSYCTALAGIALPARLSGVGSYAFCGCLAMTCVQIPVSVKYIGERAFAECTALKEVLYAGTAAQWNAISIGSGNSCLLNAYGQNEGGLRVTGIKVNRTSAVVGERIVWSATATGGRGRLLYCFYVLKDGRIFQKGTYTTAQAGSFTARAPGQYTVRVFVMDASKTVVKRDSDAITYVPDTPLVVARIKADRLNATVGETITWTAGAQGGSGNPQFCFYVLRNGIIVHRGSYGSANTISFTPTGSGNFTVRVFLRDAAGTTAKRDGGKVVVTR